MTEDSPSLRPDEILPPDGGTSDVRRLAKDAILVLPNMLKLIGRLLKDPRVPRRSKIALGMASAYVVSPIDLIPEVIPIVGWLDDLLIIAYALNRFIERAGPEIVEEHWEGEGDVLGWIQEVLGLTSNLVPRKVRAAFDRLVG
jgi:uncharacterized membrane protein YkvA (DUF1232 family)